jgi:hypothetical protein
LRYNQLLDNLYLKKKNFFTPYNTSLLDTKTEKNFLFMLTNFKKNFKYKLTLSTKFLPIMFFNIKKSKDNVINKKIDKRKIFLTQQFLIINFLKEFSVIYTNHDIVFFFKNISFLFMRYIIDFFKFFFFFNINFYYFFFNFNFSYIFNKYFKKVQTRKKFRRKIFQKSFIFDFKETYL